MVPERPLLQTCYTNILSIYFNLKQKQPSIGLVTFQIAIFQSSVQHTQALICMCQDTLSCSTSLIYDPDPLCLAFEQSLDMILGERVLSG